jgi:hypothetical protein
VTRSHSAAPHGAIVLLQGAAQQLPVPSAPQISETQSKLSPHGPVLALATQPPALQVKLGAQSKGEPQRWLQPPASAQPKLSGQGLPPVPGPQTPEPSQLRELRMASAHEVPHGLSAGG